MRRAVAATSLLRPVTSQPSPISNNMRIGRTTATALLGISSWAAVQAFVVNHPHQAAQIPTLSFTTLTARSRSSSIASTLTRQEMADNVEDSRKPTGKHVVAEGTIVSFFRGGLAAITIKDDITTTTTTTTPSSSEGASSPLSLLDSITGTASSSPPPMETTKTAGNQGDDLLGKQLVFPNGRTGVVVAQRFPIVFVLSDMDQLDDMDGVVTVLNSTANICMDDITSNVVDCFGRQIDTSSDPASTSPSTSVTKEASSSSFERAIFSPIPQVKDIALINSPFPTGTTMVDALAPMGKGQNMLVIGHDLAGMRGFASDFLATELRSGNTKCVYAITNSQDRNEILNNFRESGVLDDIIVVSARDDVNGDKDRVSKAGEAVTVAATACAIAESYALGEGQNALVIVDTIDQHKILWDATTRVLVDVYGIDAVVKEDREGGASSEMRAFYSSLVQRAGKYKKNRGDGSVTLAMLTTLPSNSGVDECGVEYSPSDFEHVSDKIKARVNILVKKNIPLTAANLRKIDIPIPSASEGKRRLAHQHVDDLISMSDGQIWLDESLAEEGQSPPIDVQRSITRVGIGADTNSRADAPALRRVVGGLRLDLAQALSMEGAEATVASEKQVRKCNAWLLAMHQEEGQGGRDLSESCVALLAASTGALDDTVDQGGLAGTKAGQDVMKNMLEHVKTVAPDAMKEVDNTLDMSPSTRSELEHAITSFFS